jgi:hypothetical protein
MPTISSMPSLDMPSMPSLDMPSMPTIPPMPLLDIPPMPPMPSIDMSTMPPMPSLEMPPMPTLEISTTPSLILKSDEYKERSYQSDIIQTGLNEVSINVNYLYRISPDDIYNGIKKIFTNIGLSDIKYTLTQVDDILYIRLSDTESFENDNTTSSNRINKVIIIFTNKTNKYIDPLLKYNLYKSESKSNKGNIIAGIISVLLICIILILIYLYRTKRLSRLINNLFNKK